MVRLLVVGAGATIEECRRSGNYANDPTRHTPSIQDFCNKLFQPASQVLLETTASYLTRHRIPFDSKLLALKAGDSFTADDMRRSPVGVFLHLETTAPEQHNIERLCEHVWHTFGSDPVFWGRFVREGIYLYLFALFTDQFGLGLGKPMLAGAKVASQLDSGDAVLSLNYDIAFDLALKQAGKTICYAPDVKQDAISVLKPHGSFNFYVNVTNGNCFFMPPDQIPGSIGISDPTGGHFFPDHGIVPPRFNKSYAQHPAAQRILGGGRPFSPKVVTFWGVGLTDSDVDLLSLYKEATAMAEVIEFINPSAEALEKATLLLGKAMTPFWTLDAWFTAHKIS